MFVSGHIGDRVNLRLWISFGMVGSGILVFLFGLARVCNIHSHAYFAIIWGTCGFIQSIGWPGCVAVMGNWFDHSRGTIFGFWSGNISTGNIVGAVLSSGLLAMGWHWDVVFFVPAFVITFWGFVLLFTLSPHPPTKKDDEEDLIIRNPEEISEDQRPLTFLRAWLIPGVFFYAISNAFIKLVNYALFFWLPFYLTEALGETEKLADLLSSLYDVGGLVGGITFGLLSDYLCKKGGGRTMVIVPMLLFSSLSFYLYRFEGSHGRVVNGFLMALVGIFVNGAYNLISSAISADLGNHESLKGNKSAMSTVTGIIDGSGSAGAAFGQLLVAWISSKWGWDATFYMLMISAILSAACLIQLFFKEFRSFLRTKPKKLVN